MADTPTIPSLPSVPAMPSVPAIPSLPALPSVPSIPGIPAIGKSAIAAAGPSKISSIYMAKLGDFMFSLDTAAFQDLQRVSEYKWQALERIGRKPAQQFIGIGADTITLSGVIHPHYRGGIGQIGKMRAMAGNGKSLPLVYAFESVGQFCGQWCIMSITEGRKVFFSDGRPRHIEFSITLSEYGPDNEAVMAANALLSAISGASVPSLASANASLKAASAGLLANASKLASGGLNVPGGMSVGAALGGQMNGMSSALTSTAKSAMGMDAGKLLMGSVPGLANAGGMASLLSTAGSDLLSANSPTQMLGAVMQAAVVARAASSYCGSISSSVTGLKSQFSGQSSGSLFKSQAGNIAGSFTDVQTCGVNCSMAANLAKGMLSA
jgi:phage protein U